MTKKEIEAQEAIKEALKTLVFYCGSVYIKEEGQEGFRTIFSKEYIDVMEIDNDTVLTLIINP